MHVADAVPRGAGFVRNAGVRVFSHADAEGRPPTVLAGGETATALLPELGAAGRLTHDRAGLVSLVALPEDEPPPPKERLVAIGGQLRTVREAPPPGPNGTGFTITVDAAPGLDATAVVVVRRLVCGALRCTPPDCALARRRGACWRGRSCWRR
jgi:hypothetical protein